jgi:hypothetical protein
VAELEKDVVAVQKVFSVEVKRKFKFLTEQDDDGKGKVEVDVVCRGGSMWIKVKAMKAQTIQNLFYGNGGFGTFST